MCNELDAISSGSVDWNRVSFSGETRFALSNTGGKMHKQALLGLLRAEKGSIWWGAVSWFVFRVMFSRRKYSLLMKNGSFCLSFVLSFYKSYDIHKKHLTMEINTDAANMQKSNK